MSRSGEAGHAELRPVCGPGASAQRWRFDGDRQPHRGPSARRREWAARRGGPGARDHGKIVPDWRKSVLRAAGA